MEEFRGSGIDLELSSFVNDIHLGSYIQDPIMANRLSQEQRLEQFDSIINEMAQAHYLPREVLKYENLVLWGKKRSKKEEVKQVTQLGVILDGSLTFEKHWQSVMQKARKLLEACNGIGNSQQVISGSTWRQFQTGGSTLGFGIGIGRIEPD